MGMDKLWESKKQMEQIRNGRPKAERPLRYRRGEGLKFEERHRRVTTYIENELFYQLEGIREREPISMTAIMNAALREYLKKYNRD